MTPQFALWSHQSWNFWLAHCNTLSRWPKQEQTKIQNWPPFSITTSRRPMTKTALKSRTVEKRPEGSLELESVATGTQGEPKIRAFFLPLERIQCRNALRKWLVENAIRNWIIVEPHQVTICRSFCKSLLLSDLPVQGRTVGGRLSG